MVSESVTSILVASYRVLSITATRFKVRIAGKQDPIKFKFLQNTLLCNKLPAKRQRQASTRPASRNASLARIVAWAKAAKADIPGYVMALNRALANGKRAGDTPWLGPARIYAEDATLDLAEG
jgi:hypothetical protein